MSKSKSTWHKVPDASIRHRWDMVCGCKGVKKSVYVSPTFYEDSGFPMCEECGEDRKYVRTEMKITARKLTS